MENVVENEKKQGFFEKTSMSLKKIFTNSNVRYALIILFLIAFGYLTQYFLNKPNLGVYLGSDMDSAGNTYVMGVQEETGQYKITKISRRGVALRQIKLPKSDKDYNYAYYNFEADSSGNFYFVKQAKKIEPDMKADYVVPISYETIVMYDTNCNYIKDIVNFDFSAEANPPSINYVQKIQLVGTDMTVVCKKENNYDVVVANPLADQSPAKLKSFTITPDYITSDADLQWVSDVCVLSGGRVFYSTRAGELYGMNNQGVFSDYTNAVSNTDFIATNMSVDSKDNIYFTDCVTGNFYKFNTSSVNAQIICGLEAILVSSADAKLKDVRRPKIITDDVFYAPSKAFDKVFYVKFGGEERFVSDVRGSIFPYGLLIMIVAIALVVGAFKAVKYLSKFEVKRIPLSVKILAMFLPLYVLTMALLVYVNTSDSVSEYMSILHSEQERGAKTVADSINGGDFTKLDHINDYMSPNYVKVKRSIETGYDDLLLKIGDRSDYLVTFIERYNKLYATLNTKHKTSSASYDRLKYTNPDMVSAQFCLVDSVLERDETQKIYEIWDKFSNKTNDADSMDASFRDVYGNLNASFVAIKDTNGRVVGMVSNFLDEDIHSNDQFNKIFSHALAVILVIAIAVFAYICFIVNRCLRPLKTIEKSIDAMGKGEWESTIRVDSKDELADIAQAFNLMFEKVGRYTSNLVRLNKEYVRYVPTGLFRLMNKEKITQVKLHDSNVVNMNIIYITFNISCKGSYDFKNEKDIFEALNKTYEQMFKIVENNHGIVQSFDGLDAVILFPNDVLDAFNASVQFKEVDLPKVIKEHININIGRGDVLVGVSGNEDRRGVVVVSDEAMQLFNIDTQINTIGIKQVATKAVIDCLNEDSPYKYRFVGRVGNITGEGFTEIYHIIDGSNTYKKDLYMNTKATFEKGVHYYLTADFENARNCFVDVLRVHETDSVAVYYLVKCEEQLKNLGNNHKGGFTGYII